MENSYVTKEVHDEFCKRIEDENARQNHRISELEGKCGQITELITSVKVLATNMEQMAKEQAKQGERLEAIEEKPAKRWETIVNTVITTLLGLCIGYLLNGGVH